MSEEESKAATQKDLDNFWKGCAEARKRRVELRRNPLKP
jgi:hypothetical protein